MKLYHYDAFSDVREKGNLAGVVLDFCGHGTLAAIHALIEHLFLTEKEEIRVETKVGISDVKVKYSGDG
ncbi:PhzF family phenazine biosynthesis protein [Listeria cornellensis]|uniref:Phenazine biosynthesis protein PhzF n=1 Tax=Listeria cornellensis FSL F6-0969 TaxID=1265820 RepID=W7BX11_9LIST|nr:PhzF family phenazine biosynthesis protein [Listeria cornellensis]EUJ27891.1 phenazine biosynthesis protein PhzF [Listeria cornellensis FSL F6-0969]